MASRRMDTKSIYPASTHLVIGRPNKGKSCLIRNVMRALSYANKVIVISGSESVSPFYSKFLPLCAIYNSFDSKLLGKIIAAQKRCLSNAESCKTHADRQKMFKERGLLLVLDDVAFQSRDIECEEFREILFNHRHLQTALIYGVQDPVLLGRVNRQMIDYVWCLQELYVNMRKRIWEWYYGMFPLFKQFDEFFIENTMNYGAVVADNITQAHSDLTSNVFVYRGPGDVTTFAIGSERFWRAAKDKGCQRKPGQGPFKGFAIDTSENKQRKKSKRR